MQRNDVSIEQVARAAGVSAATVSRALNDRAGVRDDVRDRVRLVADGLGYRPNRAAKHLAGGRTSIIGLVLPGNELSTDPYAAALVQSVAHAATQADEGLMLILDSGHPARAVEHLVRDGLVEGVVISAVAVGHRWVDELIQARMPTVLIGSHPRHPDVPVFDVECRESSARMVGHLLDSGCRRVGTITGPLDRVDAMLRHDGYLAAHRRRGLTPDPSLTFESNYTYAGGRRSVDRLLDREVDGVFAANDQMAMAVLDRAIERGIDIPRQLGIAGFDGIARDLPARMTLSTVEQPLAELGSRAVAGLVDLINGREVPDRQVLEPRLILGSTTGPGGTDPSRRAPGLS